MKPKSSEIFIPGPAGRLEGKYYKNPKFGSPVAIVLQPHPQYGGSMNNKIVQLMYNIFLENGFSVIKINFRIFEYKMNKQLLNINSIIMVIVIITSWQGSNIYIFL